MDLHQIKRVRDDWKHTASGEPLPKQDELIDAEEALLIRIPGSMRLFMMALSDLQPPGWELCTCHDVQLFSHLPEITSNAWDEGLPRHLLPLAFNQSLYAAMDESGQLVLWSRELAEIVDEFDAIDHWVDICWR